MTSGSAPELVASAAEVSEAVARVGREISADHPEGVHLVAVLRASTIFVADLVRTMTVPASIDFVALAPFDGRRARTRLIKDLDRSIAGEPVVLVNAIVDTGLSADFLRRRIQAFEPSSLKVATLADKPARRIVRDGWRLVLTHAPSILSNSGTVNIGEWARREVGWTSLPRATEAKRG